MFYISCNFGTCMQRKLPITPYFCTGFRQGALQRSSLRCTTVIGIHRLWVARAKADQPYADGTIVTVFRTRSARVSETLAEARGRVLPSSRTFWSKHKRLGHPPGHAHREKLGHAYRAVPTGIPGGHLGLGPGMPKPSQRN